MSVANRVSAVAAIPLVRSTGALVLNTGINGALGLAYWVAAARLYDPAVVGLGAGGISGLLFVASLGWIGLQQVLLRYLPVAGAAGQRLIVRVYAAAVGIALVAAAVFIVYASGDPDLSYLAAGPGQILGFLTAVALWVIFSLQDPALIGVGRTTWVPLENLGFGLAKLGLLVVFSGLASPWAIFASWILGASWLVVVISAALRRRLHAAEATGSIPEARRVVRFALGQHAIAVVIAAPDSLVPLLVLALLGTEATAFYYAAWTVSFSLRLLAVNLGSAVTVEGSRAQSSTLHLSGQVRRIASFVVVPAVVVAWLLAGWVMSIYGPRYATEATDALRLLIVAVIPFTGLTLFVVGERIAERTAVGLGVIGLTTATTLALDVVLLPRVGIAGAGWAWLIAQTIGFGLTVAITARRRSIATHRPESR